MKYNEKEIIRHLEDYIESTYSQHYTKGDFQIQDLFEHIEIAEEFCRGAAIKYLIRFGKKEGKNEKDLLKCMHYVILMYHYCGFDKKLVDNKGQSFDEVVEEIINKPESGPNKPKVLSPSNKSGTIIRPR